MFKAKQKLTSIVVACVMMIACVFGAIATLVIPQTTAVAADKKTFVKVTSAPSDWSGDYLIVYETGSVAFNGGLSTLDAESNNTAVTINTDKIELEESAKFTIAKSGNNYTIKSASGYYIGQSSNANGLKTSTSTTYSHTISINDDGSVNLVSGGAYLRYNATSGQFRFRYYKSSSYTGQKAICLYKLEEGNSSEGGEATCEHTNTTPTEEKSATCTEAGNIEYWTCNECNAIFSDAECKTPANDTKIPATGHSYGEAQETVAPTCTTAGEKTSTCTICDDVKTEAIPANGHNFEDGVCAGCGEKQPQIVTVSKTIADLITEYNWTTSTRKQEFKLDNNVTVNVGGGANSGYAANGHIRIYATDTPVVGSLTITVSEDYELASVKISTVMDAGTYAFLCVDGTETDISNQETAVSGSSVLLNTVRNGENGKQVRITEIEVTYKVKPSTQDLLNEVQAYMQLSYKYTENDGTLSNSNFWIKCAVDASLVDLANIESYGIKITAGEKADKYNDKSEFKWERATIKVDGEEKEVFYIVISLDNIINELKKLNTIFTVRAYAVVDGKEIVSESYKEYSVASMVDAYITKGYANDDNGLSKLAAHIKNL